MRFIFLASSGDMYTSISRIISLHSSSLSSSEEIQLSWLCFL